ncbi:sensor domain-containing protein [Actinoplanes sp. NPDC024001]|uniref:sensor domain-containing protein n=1 Tax=Actinoplanes sp. NPDC024001 TaxID=3154598 RepID=UPI003411D8E4
MTTTPFDVPLAPAPATRALRRLGADTRYVLTGMPLGLAAVILCLTGVAAGLGLAVVWVGVPLLAAAMMLARGFAVTERSRISAVLGEPMPQPAYRTANGPGLVRRLLAVLADPQSWRDLAHASLRFVPSTVAFSLVLAWWAGMLGSLTWSLWGWSLPNGPDERDLPELLGFGEGYLTAVGFYLVLAVLFAITLPAVVRGSALLEARFARALLGPRDVTPR